MELETFFDKQAYHVVGCDQRDMSEPFSKFFDAEVDDGGFVRGGKSFFVVGDSADRDCHIAYACLLRGRYPVIYADGRTLIRRLDGDWIPRWTDDDDHALENAEVIIIPDPFNEDFTLTLTNYQRGSLIWFIEEAIRNGVVVVIPTNDKDTNLNSMGERFGNFIEENFEVIHGTASTDQRKSSRNKSEHDRDAASIKRDRGRKREKSAGDKP